MCGGGGGALAPVIKTVTAPVNQLVSDVRTAVTAPGKINIGQVENIATFGASQTLKDVASNKGAEAVVAGLVPGGNVIAALSPAVIPQNTPTQVNGPVALLPPNGPSIISGGAVAGGAPSTTIYQNTSSMMPILVLAGIGIIAVLIVKGGKIV